MSSRGGGPGRGGGRAQYDGGMGGGYGEAYQQQQSAPSSDDQAGWGGYAPSYGEGAGGYRAPPPDYRNAPPSSYQQQGGAYQYHHQQQQYGAPPPPSYGGQPPTSYGGGCYGHAMPPQPGPSLGSNRGGRGGGGRGGRGGRGPREQKDLSDMMKGLNMVPQNLRSDEEMRALQNDPRSYLYSGILSFDDPELGIPPLVLQAIKNRPDLKQPSKIQAVTIPTMCSDRDGNRMIPHILAQAPSGSGKTAAFTIGLLAHVDPTQHYTQALVLANTREVAMQAYQWCTQMGSAMNLDIYAAVTGVYYKGQKLQNLQEACPAQVIIGTTGVIVSGIRMGNIDVSRLKVFVIDEADEMILNQKRDVKIIHTAIQNQMTHRQGPPDDWCRYFLFSATFSPPALQAIYDLWPRYNKMFPGMGVKPPMEFKLDSTMVMLDEIVQFYVDVRSGYPGGRMNRTELQALYRQKENVVAGLVKGLVGQAIIFVQRKDDARGLALRLYNDHKLECMTFTSDLSPEERMTQFAKFQEDKIKILIATNLLARGVHLPDVKLVINFDMPYTPEKGNEFNDTDAVFTANTDLETYVHRIGRTGRFGAQGIAVSIVSKDADMDFLEEIYRRYKKDDTAVLEDLIHNLPLARVEVAFDEAKKYHEKVDELHKIRMREAEEKVAEEEEEADGDDGDQTTQEGDGGGVGNGEAKTPTTAADGAPAQT